MSQAARVARAAAALVALTLAVGVARATFESHRDLGRGEAAAAAGDWESAALHLRHAAQWYVPLIGAQRPALDALVALGDTRRDGGDVEGALYCYRSARAAVMATRSLYTPQADALPPLHARIGALMAEQASPGAAPPPEAAAAYTAQLDAYRDRAPRPALAALASLAFAGWVLSLLGFATRAVGADGALRRRQAISWGAAVAATLVVWLVSVRWA